MDPLSITTSIITLAEFTYQIIGYIGQVKSGGKDRLSLCKEVTHLWLSITALQEHLSPETKGKIPPNIRPLLEPDGILEEIRSQLEDLDKRLRTQSSRGRFVQTLAWPFTQQDVLQIIQRIQRLQQTLDLILSQSTHSLAQDIYRDGQQMKKAIDETRLKEVIEWISPLNFVAKQDMIFKEHHAGTCKWFLEREDFCEWREGKNTVLFCPGIPGAGKTFLSSIVVNKLDRLRQRGEGGVEDAAIVMLYCKWDDPLSQSIDAMVASVMKQIIQRYGIVSEEVMEMYSQHSNEGTRPSREQMLSILSVLYRQFRKVFVIVDGLDELRAEKDRLALLRTLTSYETTAVNLMVTSRPLPNIVWHFRGPESIYCDGCDGEDLQVQYHCADCDDFDLCESCFDDGKRCGNKGHLMNYQYNAFVIDIAAVEEDLTTYVQWRIQSSDFLQQSVEVKDGLMDRIVDNVVKANDGMFLLAKFNMDTLESKLNIKQVIGALQVLPKELDGTYADAMTRIAELAAPTRETVMDFLRWVVFAKQPLHEREIEHALAISDGDQDIDDDSIIRARVLADKCAGLVQFDESDCVRLVHYSAENFFCQNRDFWFPESSPRLTSTCLSYLLFDPFKAGACTGPSESADFDERVGKYPFLRYASMNWGKHLLDSPSDTIYAQARKLLTDPGCLATAAQALWYLEDGKYDSWSAKDGSGIHLAAHFGLTRLVEDLISLGYDADMKDLSGATPLSLVALRGNVDVAAALIRAGASVNTVDNLGRAPLHKAIAHGHEDIVSLLLQQEGVDVNISPSRLSHETPLMTASINGRVDSIKLLLSKPEIEVNKEYTNPKGMTALILAAQYGEAQAVKALLTHPDVNINHQNQSGSTALVYAADYGHYDAVEVLLDKGADTEVLQADTEGTALMRAIDSNAVSIVQLLIKRGANVHHKDCFARGMLHSAAVNGRAEILRILLEFDKTLDVNMQDMHGKTTLHDVARVGYRETAEVLLEHGADPTIKDSHGRTPMRVARECNNTVILELLRAARARQKGLQSLPQRTNTGTIIQTAGRSDTVTSVSEPLPLWALASSEKWEELKERLSDATSADELNQTDPDVGQAALHYATSRDNVEIVRLLVSHGADVNLQSRYGHTPLHLTAYDDCLDTAEILLDAGADLEIKNQWGQLPLIIAQGHNPFVGLRFVERGASLSLKELDLNFFLRLAAQDGNETAVRRLVAAGAEIWSKDADGKTPYMIAKLNDHPEIGNLILQLAPPRSSISSGDSEDKTGTDDGEQESNITSEKESQEEIEAERNSKIEEKPKEEQPKAQVDTGLAVKKDNVKGTAGGRHNPLLGQPLYVMLMILLLITASTMAGLY